MNLFVGLVAWHLNQRISFFDFFNCFKTSKYKESSFSLDFELEVRMIIIACIF